MKHPSIHVVWARLNRDLDAIPKLVSGLTDLLKTWNPADSEHALRACATYLEDFYTAAEKIFERITRDIDEQMPVGPRWHADLLNQVASEIPGIRPPVITEATRRDLDEFRTFRHLQRNIYGHELNWERVHRLAERMPQVANALVKDLLDFKGKMLQLEQDLEP